MQLTTPQLYALAVMAVLIVALIGISYVSGLRTGRKAGEATGYDNGRRTAATYWKTIIAGNRECSEKQEALLQKRLADAEHAKQETNALLADAKQQLKTSEHCLERVDAMLGRMRAKALHADDLLNLQLAARLLGQSAKQHTRSGTSKPNQAESAQQAVKAIIKRIGYADPATPHADTILLNWLEENATVNFELETATLQFLCCPGSEIGVKSTRELLERAMFENEQINAEAAA